MKTTITIMSLLIVLFAGGLGYGYLVYDKQAKICAERSHELEFVRKACDVAREANDKQAKELQDVYASRDALAKRVTVLEDELRALNDNASRNKLAPMIAAIKTAQTLIVAEGKIKVATTSLAKDQAREDYAKSVDSVKGRRVVFTGTIKDIGKRLISFSQMYLTLTVGDGYDIKFIFEKEFESLLMSLKAGQPLVLEGYVVSTGDLMHDLTVGGPSVVDRKKYDEASRLNEGK